MSVAPTPKQVTRCGPGPWPTALRLSAALGLTTALLLFSACGGDVESQLAEIRSLQEAGQFDPSIAPLRRVLASDSNHPEANYRLGIALVQTGRPSLAVWPLQKASENETYAVQAGLVLATTLSGNGAHEEAVRAATRVLDRDPNNITALYTRANAELSAGHPEKTLADAERILQLRPDDPAAVSLRGGALVDLDRSQEAEQTFKDLFARAEVAENEGDAARKCAALATFYRTQKDIRRARETFGKCIEKYPAHPLLQQWVSDFYVEINDPGSAIEVWRNAVEVTPEDLSLRGKLADLLYGQGRVAEARKVLEEAVALFDTPEAWRMLASLQRKAGDPTAARKALESAMERTRNVSAPMRFALADMLIEEGDLARAQEIADGLDEPAYKYMLSGAILLAKEEPAKALAEFEAGLRLWPNNAGARYLAGRAAQKMGDRERALAEYREAVRVGDSETDAALRLAELHYSVGQFKSAMQFAERQIKKRPFVDAKAHTIAARSALALSQPEKAEQLLKDLLAKDSGHPAPYVELAALKRKADGPKAASEYLLASGLDLRAPENSDALRALASDYIALGRADEALARVQAAVAAHPSSAPLLDLHARVLMNMGRGAEAAKAIDAALAAEPDFAPALEAKGSLLRSSGDLDGALAFYARAAEADSSVGDYPYRAAQVHLMKNETGRASELLNRALATDPGHVGANNDLAWLLASGGQDLERALELAQRAVRMERNADTLDTLGYVHLRSGDAEQAVTTLTKALEARPDSPSIEYRLGVALAAKGDKEEARAILTKALSAPAFPEAEAARAELAKLQGS